MKDDIYEEVNPYICGNMMDWLEFYELNLQLAEWRYEIALLRYKYLRAKYEFMFK